MKPEDVPLLFAEMASEFEPIIGQPTDSDIVNITEILIEALYQISFDDEKGVHNLVGIILAPAAYLADYKEAFPFKRNRASTTHPSLRTQKIPSDPRKKPSGRQSADIMRSSPKRSGLSENSSFQSYRKPTSATSGHPSTSTLTSNPWTCWLTFSRCVAAFTPSTS